MSIKSRLAKLEERTGGEPVKQHLFIEQAAGGQHTLDGAAVSEADLQALQAAGHMLIIECRGKHHEH